MDRDCLDCVTVKPHILKKVHKPIFKNAEIEFDEEAILVKLQLLDEDENVDSTPNEGKDTVKIPRQ